MPYASIFFSDMFFTDARCMIVPSPTLSGGLYLFEYRVISSGELAWTSMVASSALASEIKIAHAIPAIIVFVATAHSPLSGGKSSMCMAIEKHNRP
jgi:hypothetical protein